MDISNKSLLKDKCFINGEWIDSYSNQTLEVDNPSTLEIIAKVPKCGKEETKFAISKANEAWNDWKSKPAIERSVLLRKWFDLIEKNRFVQIDAVGFKFNLFEYIVIYIIFCQK